MSFSPAFKLLAKFTEGIDQARKGGEASLPEIELVSQYLGVALENYDHREFVERLSRALSDQNRFLTANLSCEEIFETDLYKNSQFIREVVANNRRGRSVV